MGGYVNHCQPSANHQQGECDLCDYYESLCSAKKIFPHCDAYVLHSPGECEYCDDYAGDIQTWRQTNNVNFTNENNASKKTCPAVARRDPQKINLWYGNVAQPKSCSICQTPLQWIKLALACPKHGP